MSRRFSPSELASLPLFDSCIPESEREDLEALRLYFVQAQEWELFGACAALLDGDRYTRFNGSIRIFERAAKAARLGSLRSIQQTELYPFCDFSQEGKQSGMIYSDLMVRGLQYFPSIPDAGGGLEYRALETFYARPCDFLSWAAASGFEIPAAFMPLLEGGAPQVPEATPKAAQAPAQEGKKKAGNPGKHDRSKVIALWRRWESNRGTYRSKEEFYYAEVCEEGAEEQPYPTPKAFLDALEAGRAAYRREKKK